MCCDNCNSNRVLHVNFKSDDKNLGGGDYLTFKVCLECGKISQLEELNETY